MHEEEGNKNRTDPANPTTPIGDPNAPTEIDPKRAFEMGAETVELPNPLFWMPPKPEELESLFPGYEIQHLLGRGGMGAVYKAIQINLERFVAIKLLPPELARADPNFAERFRREAKAMAALNHQNIVTVYEFGQTEADHYYFVMEFVDGMDFHQLIRSGQLSEIGALNAVSQICDALEYAHDQGYVHRDIKPANIFINQKGILKIGDFGLAKIAKGNPQDFTRSSMTMGTPFYSAPEQIDGRPVDCRADIYSLGVMFYEMLTGDLPRGNFQPPSQRVRIDVRLDHVVLKAMAYEPERRYGTATDLRTEVDLIRTTPLTPAPESSRDPEKPGKKTSYVPAIVASLIGLLFIVGMFFFMQKQDAKDPLAEGSEAATPGNSVSVSEKPLARPATDSLAGWIDLLALVDPEKDTLSGKWTRVSGGLHGEKLPDAKGAQHLQLPYEVPEEYDFRMTLTHLMGNCEATQILSARDRQFVWHTACGQPDKWAGFSMVNGKPIMLNGAGLKLPRPREVNRRYESLVEVRRDRVIGYIDGQKLVEWKTDYQDMSQDVAYTMPNPKALGVGIWWSKTVFHEIAVREVSGKGKVLRSVALSQASGTTTTATKEAPFVNTLGMKFVPVPGTEVLFCIHEVRWKDYAAYAKANPEIAGDWKNQSSDGFVIKEKQADHPVIRVNLEDAHGFCRWLSKEEKKEYRLPTDHEWSMAVGIGRKEDDKASPQERNRKIADEYPWGSEWPPPQGVGNYSDQTRKAKAPNASETYLEGYDDGFPTTAPVMSFKPNQFGLYDLGGNVWEWVSDEYSPASSTFVLRGGSWFYGGSVALLSSNRFVRVRPDDRTGNVGFRCVLAGSGAN